MEDINLRECLEQQKKDNKLMLSISYNELKYHEDMVKHLKSKIRSLKEMYDRLDGVRW